MPLGLLSTPASSQSARGGHVPRARSPRQPTSRRALRPLGAAAWGAGLLLSGCNPMEAACQKEYDCQAETGRALEDDYVAVCKARQEGYQNVLRQNAEQVCEDLANAELALQTCLGNLLLTCEERASYDLDPDSEVCGSMRKMRDDALEAANFGLACDGVRDDEAPSESGADEPQDDTSTQADEGPANAG